jgi:twinkle protein
MPTLAENLVAQGIRLKSCKPGDWKTLCPQCSRHRKKKNDPCLSVTIDGKGAVWNCHNYGCGFSGAVSDRDDRRIHTMQSRPAIMRPTQRPGDPTPQILAWFAKRGIPEEVVRRNRIGLARIFMPALKAETDCIAFPYLRDGEVVNIKFRALADKAFSQVKDAEKILYGLDDVADSKTAIVVEGEPDKLALEVAGYRNVVSVPDGAPATVKDGEPSADDRKFSFLGNCSEQLERIEKFILAVDNDPAGRALEEELARRLGKERCWRVRWPSINDAPCKDANETLQVHGADVVRECIEAAEPYPIDGLYRTTDFGDDLLKLYRDGRSRGKNTGWDSLDKHMSIVPGSLVVVTGLPNSGKSEFVDAVLLNLATQYGWRAALCSFENPPDYHISKLAEKYLGLPFWDGPRRRMTETELDKANAWLADHFHLIRANDEGPTIDWILGKAKAAVLRWGVQSVVIDPYNQIEHRRPGNMTETEFVSQMLSKTKRFADNHGVVVFFIAHPYKMYSENGKIPVPTLYDISGSANWANKADLGIVVHRPNRDQPVTDIHIRRPRFKAFGKEGVVTLRYDIATGRYSELVPATRNHADRSDDR